MAIQEMWETIVVGYLNLFLQILRKTKNYTCITLISLNDTSFITTIYLLTYLLTYLVLILLSPDFSFLQILDFFNSRRLSSLYLPFALSFLRSFLYLTAISVCTFALSFDLWIAFKGFASLSFLISIICNSHFDFPLGRKCLVVCNVSKVR